MSDLREAIRRLHHPPVQIYSILSQAWPDLGEAEYTQNLLALHSRIRQETHRLSEALAEHEAVSTFPGDSFRPQADPRRYPPFDSRQYRFLFPDLGGPSLLRHLPEGKKYLEGLGFDPGKPGVLQESEFYLWGSPSLDFIEIAVRDMVGIDRGVHGKQIRAISGAGFMLRNRVMEMGERRSGPCQWAVLYFEKPGTPGTISYEIFRAALRTLLEDHLERGSFPYVCLHQRKLGLGRGAEFSLRVQLPHGPDPKLDAFLHDLFHEEGALEALRYALTIQDEIPVP
ncbi:MAG: hypothetical protein L0Z52_04960 [Acidobacteria bacterium]|nr:hypothetical protein [Acidobacteriota bacterium]